MSISEHAIRFLTAVQHDDTTRAVDLLRAQPDVARWSIHTAAATGDANTVRAFLEAGSSATAALDTLDIPPLVFAVAGSLPTALGVSPEQQLATVQALLDAGADANASALLPDGSGRIPALFFPCVRGDVALARALLARGANPTDGESLYHAAQHDHRDCLALLRQYGADLDRGPDPAGNTPLYFLAAHGPRHPLGASVLRGMTWLLEQGANPNVPSYPGRTGHAQAGETPLHRAAAEGHDAVLRLLVDHGALMNQRRDDGATAYQLTVRSGNAAGARVLTDAGADTTLSPTDRLIGACLAGDHETARSIVAEHPLLVKTLDASTRDAIHTVIERGNGAALRLMLDLGWSVTHESAWGGTPLHWAAWFGRHELVTLLLTHGAAVNVRDAMYGSSPIAWAAHGSANCERGNDTDYPRIVGVLLDAGATRAESINQWGEPPERMARPSVAAVFEARGFAD